MGAIRLHRFATADGERLGFLLARLKESGTSPAEEAELFALLTRARRVSELNTKALAEMRNDEGKDQAKTS
jgi:hypothetical protein